MGMILFQYIWIFLLYIVDPDFGDQTKLLTRFNFILFQCILSFINNILWDIKILRIIWSSRKELDPEVFIGWASGCVFPVIPIIWIEGKHRHTTLFYQSPESVLLACLHGLQVAHPFVCCGGFLHGMELGTRMCSVKSIVDSDMITSRGVAVAAPDRFKCMECGSPQEGGQALRSP